MTDSPEPGCRAGLDYLVRPDCLVGSWQTSLGAGAERGAARRPAELVFAPIPAWCYTTGQERLALHFGIASTVGPRCGRIIDAAFERLETSCIGLGLSLGLGQFVIPHGGDPLQHDSGTAPELCVAPAEAPCLDDLLARAASRVFQRELEIGTVAAAGWGAGPGAFSWRHPPNCVRVYTEVGGLEVVILALDFGTAAATSAVESLRGLLPGIAASCSTW